MARLVRHEGTGPYRLEPQEKAVFICGCGLTRTFPFCDGTHKTCRDEEPGRIYRYDHDPEQGVVRSAEPDAPGPPDSPGPSAPLPGESPPLL